MQAGKDVYVEKPLANNHWEGQQIVAAARNYKRICQVGTQQRSDPMQAEIKTFLHTDQKLGKIESVRVNRYGVRQPIGEAAICSTNGSSENLSSSLRSNSSISFEPIKRDKHSRS